MQTGRTAKLYGRMWSTHPYLHFWLHLESVHICKHGAPVAGCLVELRPSPMRFSNAVSCEAKTRAEARRPRRACNWLPCSLDHRWPRTMPCCLKTRRIRGVTSQRARFTHPRQFEVEAPGGVPAHPVAALAASSLCRGFVSCEPHAQH